MTPTLALMVGIRASMLSRLGGNGPFVLPLPDTFLPYWWHDLLYINNFFETEVSRYNVAQAIYDVNNMYSGNELNEIMSVATKYGGLLSLQYTHVTLILQ